MVSATPAREKAWNYRASGTKARAAGFCCGIGAGGWINVVAPEEGVNDIFCLMSSSTACNAAMF